MSTAALGNANPPPRQPTILVVEDHDDTREMLHLLLEMWGYRVVEACNGLEAVAAALRERPQLILMDSRLPFLDGLEATRRIRENGFGSKLRFWRSMVRAAHSITLTPWRRDVMILLKNPLILTTYGHACFPRRFLARQDLVRVHKNQQSEAG